MKRLFRFTWRVALVALAVHVASFSRAADDEFEPPIHVLADGKPLDVERSGHAAPFVGDLDGDGRDDLLVGQYGDGVLRLYRNLGERRKPKFEHFEWFQAGGELGKVPSS